MERKEKIIASILDSGKTESENIVKNANAEFKKIISEASIELDKIFETKVDEAKIDLADKFEMTKSKVSLVKSRAMLEAKNKIIDKIFEKVLNSLNALDKKDYIKIITNFIKKYASNSDTIIVGNSEDVDLIKKLAIVKSKELNIEFSRERFGRGIIVSNKNTDIDLTFDYLVKEKKDEMICELAKNLFKEE